MREKTLNIYPLTSSLKRLQNPSLLIKVRNKSLYQVEIDFIKDVKEADFKQAQVTWEKLEEAGLNPGELVSWGLSFGHDYNIQNLAVPPQNFYQVTDLLSESVISEEVIIGYSFTRKLLESCLEDEEHFQKSLVPLNQIIEVEDSLVLDGDSKGNNIVKMTAIFKQKPTDFLQLEEVNRDDNKV